MLALGACVSTSVFAPKTPCSSLIPEAYSTPVPDAAAPVEGSTDLDTFQSWVGFGIAQTANKQTEFERAQAARQIVERCEERDAEAIDESRSFLDRVFG